MSYEILEVKIQTDDEREGTRIDIAVETIEHFRINTIVVSDSEHIRCGHISTSANAMILGTLEEVLKAIAQGDVVTLQE